MKTATVRHIQHHLSEVLEWVEQGEHVTVTRRNRIVATIIPVSRPNGKIKMPNFLDRMRSKYPHKPISKAATRRMNEELREERH